MHFGVTLGYLGVTWGSPWGRIRVGSDFGTLCGHFGTTLGSLCAVRGHFGFTLGSLWGHFGITLESFWGYVGMTLVSLWGYFGITLGSLWGHFGVTLGSLWAYRRRFARLMHIISPCVRSKRVHKQEIHILPTCFAFQKSRGGAKSTNTRAGRTVWEGVGGG